MTAPNAGAKDQDWARRAERGSPALIRFIVWLARRVGRRPARALLHPISLYFLICAPSARRQSRAFLTRALGRPAGLGESYRHLHHFAATLLDRVYFVDGRLNRYAIEIEGLAALKAAHAKGRGVILLGAHFGSFDAMRALAENYDAAHLKVLMHEGPDARVAAALAAINPRFMDDIIPLGEPRSMMRVHEWLRGGGMIGMLGDRVPRGDRTRRLPFLGDEAAFPVSPWLLAAITGAPVVMFAAVYLGGNRYMIRFETLADAVERPRDRRRAGFDAEMMRYAATLERWAVDYPYNWFNFHDFWA